MVDTIQQFIHDHQALLWWVAAGSGVLLLLSLLSLPVVAVMLPRDFLRDDARVTEVPPRHPAMRLALRILRNILGALLVLLAIPMLIGPGQGVLMLTFGLLLMDTPGKRRLKRRVLGSPRVFNLINRIRQRYGKPPLDPPDVA